MNLQLAKYQIIQQLINLDNVNLVLEIKSLIEQTPVNPSKRMSIEEFYDRISASDIAYQEGRVTSHQNLKHEIKSWKDNS